MTVFFTVTAILAWLFGLALLLVPAKFYIPTGITMTPLLATVAQAHGATLIGLGFINWFARNFSAADARGVLWGNFVLQVLSLVVAVMTMRLGAGSKVAPALVI